VVGLSARRECLEPKALVRAGLFTNLGWGGAGDGNVFGLSRAGRQALEHGTFEAVLSDDTAAS
jgi:hypothetical protein